MNATIIQYQIDKVTNTREKSSVSSKTTGMAEKKVSPVEKTAIQVITMDTLIMYFHFWHPQIMRRMMLNEESNAIMSKSRNAASSSPMRARPGFNEDPSSPGFPLSLVCVKPPGGLNPAWNVTVAISVATTINVFRVSLYLSGPLEAADENNQKKRRCRPLQSMNVLLG